MATEPVVTVTPFGGEGGNPWDDGYYTTVRQIVIHTGDFINGIQIEYDDNGNSKWGDLHGGNYGGKTYVVGLYYPTEYLISISGYYNVESEGGNIVIQSLTIQSNRKRYGPYGSESGTYFSFPPGTGKIVGFLGRSGAFLDAIGGYIQPYSNVVTAGPFGGSGGRVWDDGIHTGVKWLIIASGSFIDSITIKYDDDGQSFWSCQHGQSEGGTKNLVTLDYPNEYLTSISGYITGTPDFRVLCSLTLQSNKNTYGPYGNEEGEYFSSAGVEGKVIGFFGGAGDYVDALGVYVAP